MARIRYCTGRWPCGCGVLSIAILNDDLHSARCVECETGRIAALPPDPEILDEAKRQFDVALERYAETHHPGLGWLSLARAEADGYVAEGDVGTLLSNATGLGRGPAR